MEANTRAIAELMATVVVCAAGLTGVVVGGVGVG